MWSTTSLSSSSRFFICSNCCSIDISSLLWPCRIGTSSNMPTGKPSPCSNPFNSERARSNSWHWRSSRRFSFPFEFSKSRWPPCAVFVYMLEVCAARKSLVSSRDLAERSCVSNARIIKLCFVRFSILAERIHNNSPHVPIPCTFHISTRSRAPRTHRRTSTINERRVLAEW
jgi:hypothetical protein